MNLFILSLFMLGTVPETMSEAKYPYAQYSMQCYPTTIAVGDTLYIVIEAENPYDKIIYTSDSFWPITRDIQFSVTDSKNQTIPLLIETSIVEEFARFLRFVGISPGENRTIVALAMTVPPLEDLNIPFWKNRGKEFSDGEEIFTLNATIAGYYVTEQDCNFPDHLDLDRDKELLFKVKNPIVIKPRPEGEMKLIDTWYRNTLPDQFPVLNHDNDPPTRKITNPKFREAFESKTIRIRNKKFSQWYCKWIGNRYPGDPNCPETWQGWKELEESLTPSTMRDEIRMTRIVIQYLDTEESKVLDELTEWLQTMNEIQRIVMVQNVMKLKNRFPHDYNLRTPMNKLIETIQPFATETNTESIQ